MRPITMQDKADLVGMIRHAHGRTMGLYAEIVLMDADKGPLDLAGRLEAAARDIRGWTTGRGQDDL